MELKRAIELCEEPLAMNNSHIVRVDRFALRHILDDRTGHIKQEGALENNVKALQQTIEKMQVAYDEAEAKIAFTEAQLKECQQLVEAAPTS